MKWSEEVAQSCLTLCNPIIIHGILQARILEWVAVPFSRVSSQPRDQTQVSCIAGGFFTSWATREALYKWYYMIFFSLSDVLHSVWPVSRSEFVGLSFRQLNFSFSWSAFSLALPGKSAWESSPRGQHLERGCSACWWQCGTTGCNNHLHRVWPTSSQKCWQIPNQNI